MATSHPTDRDRPSLCSAPQAEPRQPLQDDAEDAEVVRPSKPASRRKRTSSPSSGARHRSAYPARVGLERRRPSPTRSRTFSVPGRRARTARKPVKRWGRQRARAVTLEFEGWNGRRKTVGVGRCEGRTEGRLELAENLADPYAHARKRTRVRCHRSAPSPRSRRRAMPRTPGCRSASASAGPGQLLRQTRECGPRARRP